MVVVGGAMTAYWLNVLWSMSAQLYWDKDAGNLALYIVSPGSLMAILLGLARISDLQLVLVLLGATVVTGVVSISFFRWSEHRAREKGSIDMTTHY